ncbi:hypothetical protein D1007_14794 [Hordeum vulgare]|nr:hypothetical protein D1007_14794 [Hordeum vulgare]
MEFGLHHVDTHFRNTDLMEVYTNDPTMLENSINTMEWLLAAYDKYKVFGFDLAYNISRVGHDQKVCSNSKYKFSAFHDTNDRMVIKTSGLACEKLVDNHEHYKVWGSKKAKDSHVDLAQAIIDPYYIDMKDACDKNKHVWHRAWVKRLDDYHIPTATKEAYTCYVMFRRIVDTRKCLVPEDDLG